MQRIKIILFTSKTFKKGTKKGEGGIECGHPVMIRVTGNDQRKYIYTGLRCMKEHWNPDTEGASDKYRGAGDKDIIPREEFDEQIQILKDRIADIKKKFKKEKNYNWTVSDFVNEYNLDARNEIAVLDFFDTRIKFFEKSGRIGTAQCYKGAKVSFRKYLQEIGKGELTFREVDYPLIEGYKGWMESKTKYVKGKIKPALTKGGIAVYMRTLRAVYRSAIDAELTQDKKPFKNGIIPIGEPLHRALSEKEFMALKEVRLEDPRLERARELFLISFYLRGINFADLALMKVSQIKDDIVHYKRTKTARRKQGAKEFKIRIPKQILPIMNEYLQGKTKDEYLFGLISDKANTPQKLHDAIRNARLNIGNALRQVVIWAGIDTEHFSFYSARHTFATLSLRKGASTREIMEGLGHSNIETTETYLEGFEDSELDDIFEKRLKKL
jgi:integrase